MANKLKLMRQYAAKAGHDFDKVRDRVRSISGPQRTKAYYIMRETLKQTPKS